MNEIRFCECDGKLVAICGKDLLACDADSILEYVARGSSNFYKVGVDANMHPKLKLTAELVAQEVRPYLDRLART